MFSWKLTARVEECAGVAASPKSIYTLIMRLDNKFSAPTEPAQLSGTRLRFNTDIVLHFTTNSSQLPSSSLQIMLVCSQPAEGHATTKEDIIGMASIRLAYPLSTDLASTKIHKFDKSLDCKATIKASLALQRSEVCQFNCQSTDDDEGLPSDALEEILSLEREQNEAYQSHLKFLHSELGEDLIQEGEEGTKQRWEEIKKERDELYKMSQDLYNQLKKCMAERDLYLKELREKELSQEQTKEELEFLKLKIEEYEGGQQEATPLLLEVEALRDDNADLRRELELRQNEVKELKRQVRESFIAIDQFKKEALQARSELIHKESEMSMITRQSKYLDPFECIEELYQELQHRKLEQTYSFNLHQDATLSIQTFLRQVKKQIAHLFTQLLQKMKLPKDREWVLQQKIVLESKIDGLYSQ